MGHDHSHAGHQHAHGESTKNLGIAFFLNLGFAVIEVVGGIWTNSVAIISDAVHDFGDAFFYRGFLFSGTLFEKEEDRDIYLRV